MYLTINEQRFSVSRRIATIGSVKFFTVTPDPGEVSGTVKMFRNDGFLLSEDHVSDYARQSYSGTLLTLTNEPEREPEPYSPSDIEVLNALLGLDEGVM